MVEQQGQPQAAQPLTLLGVVERLLAGVAVTGAAIYVLINALYVEFYDDFSVRPEDVGWDRLAVLGRAAWVALVGIAVVGTIGWAYSTVTTRRRRRDLEVERRLEKDKQKAAELGETDLLLAYYARIRMEEEEVRRLRVRRLLGAASLASTVLILVGFYLLERQVEDEAARAKRGENANGVSFIVPFIDARATRANVTWLGDKEKRPVELGSPYLMYLGRGRDVAVFLACGRTTVLVPADDVAIDLLGGGREGDRVQDRERQQFNDLCGG
jgi:hypothetical protein